MNEIISYFARPEIILEIVKLLVQLVGALFVAKIAVRWALERFKSEKLWDRGLTSLADTISALREIERVYDIWVDEHFSGDDFGADHNQMLNNRIHEAKKKFESASSVAILTLPRGLTTILIRIEKELANNGEPGMDWFEHIDGRAKVVSDAIAELLKASSENGFALSSKS